MISSLHVYCIDIDIVVAVVGNCGILLCPARIVIYIFSEISCYNGDSAHFVRILKLHFDIVQRR